MMSQDQTNASVLAPDMVNAGGAIWGMFEFGSLIHASSDDMAAALMRCHPLSATKPRRTARRMGATKPHIFGSMDGQRSECAACGDC